MSMMDVREGFFIVYLDHGYVDHVAFKPTQELAELYGKSIVLENEDFDSDVSDIQIFEMSNGLEKNNDNIIDPTVIEEWVSERDTINGLKEEEEDLAELRDEAESFGVPLGEIPAYYPNDVPPDDFRDEELKSQKPELREVRVIEDVEPETPVPDPTPERKLSEIKVVRADEDKEA
jgi:hypothetical protein